VRLAIGALRLGFGWRRHAGLIAVWNDSGMRPGWAFHFFVQRSHWVWGREFDEWLDSWGFGPIGLLVQG
jgi:hypothetical protein